MDRTRVIRQLHTELDKSFEIVRALEKVAYRKPARKRPSHAQINGMTTSEMSRRQTNDDQSKPIEKARTEKGRA